MVVDPDPHQMDLLDPALDIRPFKYIIGIIRPGTDNEYLWLPDLRLEKRPNIQPNMQLCLYKQSHFLVMEKSSIVCSWSFWREEQKFADSVKMPISPALGIWLSVYKKKPKIRYTDNAEYPAVRFSGYPAK